jgi:hypothetical protein
VGEAPSLRDLATTYFFTIFFASILRLLRIFFAFEQFLQISAGPFIVLILLVLLFEIEVDAVSRMLTSASL